MSAITVGAAQLGPIARAESRSAVVKRLIAHLHEARARGCDLVVFPELALTTFFPRWAMQRPPLARDVQGDGPAGRRDGAARLQHARAQSACPGARRAGQLPQRPRHAGRRLPERCLGGRVAKCGREEGVDQIGQSQIVAPSGETVAMASTLGDELVVARCDLGLCRSYKTTVFDFAATGSRSTTG